MVADDPNFPPPKPPRKEADAAASTATGDAEKAESMIAGLLFGRTTMSYRLCAEHAVLIVSALRYAGWSSSPNPEAMPPSSGGRNA